MLITNNSSPVKSFVVKVSGAVIKSHERNGGITIETSRIFMRGLWRSEATDR